MVGVAGAVAVAGGGEAVALGTGELVPVTGSVADRGGVPDGGMGEAVGVLAMVIRVTGGSVAARSAVAQAANARPTMAGHSRATSASMARRSTTRCSPACPLAQGLGQQHANQAHDNTQVQQQIAGRHPAQV
jgi:hypothetical protein